MQGLKHYSSYLDLTPPPTTTATTTTNIGLSIDEAESSDEKIQRLISEHPVIIFSGSSCYMCHVMRKLLATIGVNPTVIELEDHEIPAIPMAVDDGFPTRNRVPVVFIGGACVGGLESLVALHLSNCLVPKLVEVGVL